jgi:hypothetical protein
LYFDIQLAVPDTSVNVVEAMELYGLDILVYPNPTSDMVQIGFEKQVPGATTVAIYDMAGRMVQMISQSELPQGRQLISYDSSLLAAGSYVIRIHDNAQQWSHPLIVQKR